MTLLVRSAIISTMNNNHWLTISLPLNNQDDAEALAEQIAREHAGRVVQVEPEPPQGSTIVGDFFE